MLCFYAVEVDVKRRLFEEQCALEIVALQEAIGLVITSYEEEGNGKLSQEKKGQENAVRSF